MAGCGFWKRHGGCSSIIQGSRWSGRLVVAAFLIGRLQTLFPSAIVTIFPPLMGIDGVVAITFRMGGKPRVDPFSIVTRGIIVPKIVVVIARTEKEAIGKNPQVNPIGGSKVEAGHYCYAEGEENRCKQHAPMGNGKVPIAPDENISPGCPDIMSGDPDPVRPHDRPVTGPPGISFTRPYPAAGNPGMVR